VIDQVTKQPRIEEFKNMLDIEVIENPKSDKESNKYVLVATLQHEENADQKSGSDEVITVKAFKQRYEDKRGKDPPWTSSKEASRRATEELERAKQAQKENHVNRRRRQEAQNKLHGNQKKRDR
jgi:hypothetical protein